MNLRKLCLQSIIVCFLMYFCTMAIAEENKQTKQTAPALNTQQERIVFHIAGSKKNASIATAIELLMMDRLLPAPQIKLVPQNEVITAAIKGKALQKNRQIFSRDIPYLCLKTDTSKALFGFLDIYNEKLIFSLRTFDGISATNLNGKEISGNIHNIPAFIEEALKAVSEVLEKEISYAEADLKKNLDLATLETLGKNWLKLSSKGNKKNALLGLIKAGKQGATLQNISELLGNKKEKITNKKDQALLNDLIGKYQEALVLYSGIKLNKKSLDYHFRHAQLLLQQGQYQKLRSKLKEIEKFAAKDKRLQELSGWHLLKIGHKHLALSKWQAKGEFDFKDPEIFNLIAADALDRTATDEAVKACVKLAEYYTERKRSDLASLEFLRALQYGGPAKLLDKVRIDLLSKTEKENLLRWIESEKTQTEHHMLAKAKIMLLENKNDQALDLLLQASQSSNENIEFELGKYFLEKKPDIDRSISYLNQARKVGSEKPELTKALAKIYMKAQFCYKSIPFANQFIKQQDNNPRAVIEVSSILLNCDNKDGAIRGLNNVLEKNPDYSPASAELARIYHQLNDEDNKKKELARLKKIDIKMASSLFAEKPKVKEPVIKKQEEKLPKLETKSKRSKVKVVFPATEKMANIIPEGLGRVALINMNDLNTSFGSKLFKMFLSPNTITPDPIDLDFANLIQADSEVIDVPDANDLIELGEGSNPFKPNSFIRAIETYKLDAVALYELKEGSSADRDVVNVTFYTYVKGGKEILSSSGEISFGADKLKVFNPLIGTIPVVILLALLILLVFKKQRGYGKLIVKINFDRSFEDYYFAVRVSPVKLDQPFKLDKLMKKKWSGKRQETEDQINKFFKSHGGMVTVANKKLAAFDRILTGEYFVYVTGIMVNIDNQKPLTSFAVDKNCKVEKNIVNDLDIKFDVKEAYIDIRVTREVKTKKKITETVEGEITEVERKVTRWEEVAGATVSINNDPAYEKTSIAGEPVSYNLPFGQHNVVANFEGLQATHALVIDGTESRTIEIRLTSKLPTENTLELTTTKADNVLAANSSQPDILPAEQPAKEAAKADKVPSDLPFDIDNGLALDDSDFGVENDISEIPVEHVELSDDILGSSGPLLTHETTDVVNDNTQMPIDTEDLFKAASQMPKGELAGINDHSITESEKREFRKSAKNMQSSERWDEAAELYLRAGEYNQAIEMAQKSNNQIMTYKIYGVSYLKQGQFSEAAEMFKSAEELLLEAEALEGLRLFDEANKKRGIYWESLGDITRSMKAYEKAGAWDRIAMLHERMQNYQQAGQAYYKAREYNKAADCFINSNDIKSAAEAFEMNGQYDKAAEYFQKLGSNVKVFNLLEKSGKYCEAAEGYKKFGLLDEAVHACQQVSPQSEEYLKAALIMGKVFTDKNEVQLARSVYHKVVDNANINQTTIEKYYEFGVLIQEQGQLIEALSLYEKLQTFKYNYADITIRIKNLQEQIEEDHSEHGTEPPPGSIPPFPGYKTGVQNLTNNSEEPVTAGQTPISSRYAFEQELGRGAMGIVYKAKDTALDRMVAYKTVSNAIKDNPASLKYFLSEAKSLAALNHSNVVTVFDVGQENHNYYITMEYVDGRSLADFVREKGRLSTRNCVVIATKICSGLEYAHSKNVVHRDIKPSNIMISNQGDVKIMDFGLAKIMTEASKDKTIVRGTPLYMSPEQVEGFGIDHTSDVYSFGVTMFEMATGTLPFTKGDIAYHHLHTAPPSPIRYNPSIPEALERIILKCLSKKKEERYQTASEIKRDLAPLRAALMKG